ncbi:MAG: flagellar basal body rod protein FlgB [Pseudomonadota bacterium]
MSLSLDKAFGIYAQSLSLRAHRAELLANNIANADTPNYKAVDIDFKTALANAGSGQLPMATSNSQHIQTVSGNDARYDVRYRVPLQPALDGNTVDTQIEQAEFSRNAVQHQSSLTFLNGRINGILLAIKGQ